MASDNEASCASDPNFAVICSFLQCFGKSCGILYPDIARLQEMLENTQEVSQQLIDLHIKLLRKTRKTVSPEKWERALVKFCHTYSNQDGWELERFGYKKARVAVKLRLLKVLLESQFDQNQKFKNEVNKLAAEELRVEPLGRDKSGQAYWCQLDEDCNIRVYKEDLDEESWELIAKDRDGVVDLINTLSNGEAGCIPINEDSNSLEISEKPITDTGQVETSPSLEDEGVQENGIHINGSEEKEPLKDENEDSVDQQVNDSEMEDEEDDDEDDEDEDEDDDEGIDEATQDECSKQNTEEDSSQETVQNQVPESKSINPENSLPTTTIVKAPSEKMDKPEEQVPQEKIIPKEIPPEMVEPVIKVKEPIKEEPILPAISAKVVPEEKTGLKSIETPVITSPLKLVNITELKQPPEEKNIGAMPAMDAPITMVKKPHCMDETSESVMKSLEKLTGKNNLSFSAVDITSSHNKVSLKPIDQLAANLVRIQSEKLEKPSGAKTLEKIAENLARTSSVIGGSQVNGEDDRLPQDFCARNQTDKSASLRGHRGIDLSTSPRGWESVNEQSRPVDFSGIDLSSRKFTKTMDLPPSGYRSQDIQHREMDLSTKKVIKPDVPNLPYDARSVMLRNQAMVADLSKRQMSYSYDMSSAAYHNTGRLPAKDEHRLPSYTILPDPSKLAALRMAGAPVKRPLEAEEVQQDMLKRLRADVIPIRGSMDKRPLLNSTWREDVGEAIEEPLMMVQGEGSGSDCDAVNPLVGEAIEEPPIFFYGEGSGADCDTGNPGEDTSTDNKESNESKSEPDSASAALSPNKILPDDSLVNEVSPTKNAIKLNRNFPQSSVSVAENCQVVGSTQEKPKFKPTLGVQIIQKTASGSAKRLSRWDVGKPEDKPECDSSIISNEGDISPMECANECQGQSAEQKSLLPESTENENSVADVRQNEKSDAVNSMNDLEEEKDENHAACRPSAEQNCSLDSKKIEVEPQESMQCDSSMSACPADTSEAADSCTEPEVRLEDDKDVMRNVSESNGCEQSVEKGDNECNTPPESPPRFFFGPNCISYTSRSDEPVTQSEDAVSTSVRCKSDTLQYEQVSSSKPTENISVSYKPNDTEERKINNNNSLKVASFDPSVDDLSSGADEKKLVCEVAQTSEVSEGQSSPECSRKEEEPEKVLDKNCDDRGSREDDLKDVESEENVEEKRELNLDTHCDVDEIGKVSSEAGDSQVPLRTESFESESVSLESSTTSSNELSHPKDRKIEDAKEVSQSPETPEVSNNDMHSTVVLANEVDHKLEMINENSEKAESNPADISQRLNTEVSAKSFEDDNVPNETRDFTNMSPNYNMMNSSKIMDVGDGTNHFPTETKPEVDSSAENFDKQSEKTDNLSEFDAQDEQFTDADSEKLKGMASSDTDSMCVNFDKTSERNYAFSDAGTQDEGSGDSQEEKEKIVDTFDKEESNVNANTNSFIDLSATTSADVSQEYEKDIISPVVSSTHESFPQDVSFGDKALNVLRDENTSIRPSVFSAESIQPAIVPNIVPNPSLLSGIDTSICGTLLPPVVKKDSSFPGLIEAMNEDNADNLSENPSSCIDQDSNQDMVIDERTSDSSKEADEVMSSEEKLSLDEDALPLKEESMEQDRKPLERFLIGESREKESFEGPFDKDETDGVKEKSQEDSSEEETMKINEDVPEQQSERVDEPEEEAPEVEEQNVEKEVKQEERPTVPPPEDVTEQKVDQPAADKPEEVSENPSNNLKSETELKPCLVANYDSDDDSNDVGSNSVFESETTDVNKYQDNDSCDLDKEAEEIEKPEVDNDAEEFVEDSDDKVSVEVPVDDSESREMADKCKDEEDVVNKKGEVPDSQCSVSDKALAGHNESSTENKDLLAVENLSEKVKDSESAESTAVEESHENASLPNEPCVKDVAIKNHEPIEKVEEQTELEDLSESVSDVKEGMEKSCVLGAEKLPDATAEETNHSKEIDDTSTAEESAGVKDNVMNDVSKGDVDVPESKEQLTNFVENTLSDINDKKDLLQEADAEKFVVEKSIVCEELKKEVPEEQCKVEAKEETKEENHSNEVPLQKVEASEELLQTALPTSLEDNHKLEEPGLCKADNFMGPNNASKFSGSVANFISEKVEETNVMSDVKQLGPFNSSANALECYAAKPPLINDTAAVLTAEEPLRDQKDTLHDFKKDASKRQTDALDMEDVPPLKSKPPLEYPDSKELDTVGSPEMPVLSRSVDETEITAVDTAMIKTESSIPKIEAEEKKEVVLEVAKEVPAGDVLENSAMDVNEKKEPEDVHSIEMKEMSSDDSMDGDNGCSYNAPEEDVDPLAGTEDDALKKLTDGVDITDNNLGLRVKTVTEIAYEGGWKLDGTETPKLSRKRRNSAHESNSEDADAKLEEDEMMGGKRIKLRGKRPPDKQLRKSVEDSRIGSASSEDELAKDEDDKTAEEEGKTATDDPSAPTSVTADRKIRGRPRGRRRRGNRSLRYSKQKRAERQNAQAMEGSAEGLQDGTPTNTSLDGTPSTIQKRRKKRKMVLGLEIGRDIAPEGQGDKGLDETPVRQSRRIAQLKIKEEADRRRIEEEALSELKGKKDGSEKKKKRKQKAESEEEMPMKDIEKEKKSKKKRKKRKRKKMLAKFNEANPWQSSSGSSSDEDDENEDDEDEEDEIESEGSLLFKSDHEFSPESDLEKDQEAEPLRRARTAQKAQSDDEEADDEYACQKCGKADHPEWILLCDTCDKGWHCSCLRPALMLIPEGDWFCPPCQHNVLVSKLRESLKTYDQLTKRHENEILRKKRLAFVGISLDNVLQKNEIPQSPKESRESSQESDNETTSTSSESSSENTSSDESEPVYQLRERRCANTYKFNEYDDMINAAIQDEVEAVQGAGNQGRGKDITTIVNAEKEEAQLQLQAEAFDMQEIQEDKEDVEKTLEKESDEEYKVEKDDEVVDEDEEERKIVAKKLLARRKHRKLNSLDISSEDDPESDEDFKGTSSEDEEDFDEHITSSDDSSLVDIKRRGRKGDSRPVRRSTRARMTRYDEDFINDDSEDSDRPKRKKSRSMWGDSDSEDSDNSWVQRKKKSRTVSASRSRTSSKTKTKKKKKRKRIIESDNQSDNNDEDDSKMEGYNDTSQMDVVPHVGVDGVIQNNEGNMNVNNTEMKPGNMEGVNAEANVAQMGDIIPQKKKKETVPKQKKIRRKIIYGGLPDDNVGQEEETLGRRTRGRKINYQEEMATDSEEELKKALRKTGESEDEFVVNEGEDMNDDAEKDSDSGDIYTPKKDAPKFKNKSPKTKRMKKSRSPGTKRRTFSDDSTPKQRRKPGPKPGSKNKPRKQNLTVGSMMYSKDGNVMGHVLDNPLGDMKKDEDLSENVGLPGAAMSVTGSFTGDVPEGSLTSLGPGELAELDDEQLEQMMMEDEEYGRRQLELAAIEIAKKKKKEEREAKKLEKARLKALEILAAERQRDPNALEGTDGEVPKKKKRGRRSKAEILAEQMRRDGAPELAVAGLPQPAIISDLVNTVSPNINPSLSASEAERTPESHLPLITGPDGQLFTPDGSPLKPKRRGRGKGKKTLALEAARAAEAAAKGVVDVGLLGMGTDSNSESKLCDNPNILPTPGSSTSGSAPSTPPAGVITTQGPPSTQPSNSQPVYPALPPNQQSSVITRMLQSQPVASSPQSFTAAAAAMGHKYFGGPNTPGQMMGGPRTGYEMQPRGRIPSPYRQAGQAAMPPHFAAVRSGTPPMRMRVPGPQMYHTPHHPMDPSPSGGGPISINNRDRSSPLGPGPAMIPPAAGSPLAKGGPTPPPPPYVRGAPALSRFQDNPMAGPRHQLPPFANASPANHSMQQPSPPPNRPPGNFSPYHPPPPPNYHYGAYPPPPPMSTADDAAAYQGSPYPPEHFSSPADSQPPTIQAPPPPQPPQQGPPPPPQQPQPHPDAPPGSKQYDEEGTGEFGGLVSYFSSQREDDLDS